MLFLLSCQIDRQQGDSWYSNTHHHYDLTPIEAESVEAAVKMLGATIVSSNEGTYCLKHQEGEWRLSNEPFESACFYLKVMVPKKTTISDLLERLELEWPDIKVHSRESWFIHRAQIAADEERDTQQDAEENGDKLTSWEAELAEALPELDQENKID